MSNFEPEPVELPAPPISEDIHLPDPTIKPVMVAFGLTLIVIGLTIWPGIVIAGAVITVVTIALWIRDVAHDIEELPPTH